MVDPDLAKSVELAMDAVAESRERNALYIAMTIARRIYGTPVPDSADSKIERLVDALKEML
jgi:hypothetical protein